MFNALEYDLECFMLSYATECCTMLYVLIYIWLLSSSGRGRNIDDQVLDLALMTNYSQSTFMCHCCWLVVSICIDSVLSGLVVQHLEILGKVDLW